MRGVGRVNLRLVVVIDTVLVIAGRREVDVRRECAVRVSLTILSMRPRDAETVGLAVCRQVFLSSYIASVLDVDVAAELVALDISRLGVQRPRTFGIDIAGDLQIHVIVDSPVVTESFQVQTTVILIAVSRHNESG